MGKAISFAVVSMTANSYLRIKDIEGLCDDASPQRSVSKREDTEDSP